VAQLFETLHRMIAGSIPDGVIGIFIDIILSCVHDGLLEDNLYLRFLKENS